MTLVVARVSAPQKLAKENIIKGVGFFLSKGAWDSSQEKTNCKSLETREAKKSPLGECPQA